MSLGSHIRALTARKATPNKATIKIGKRVERKKPKVQNVLNHPHSAPL